jgi:hypothetical protein
MSFDEKPELLEVLVLLVQAKRKKQNIMARLLKVLL